MSLDKLRPKKHEHEKSKLETDKYLRKQILRDHPINKTAPTKKYKEKVESNLRRDAVTGGLETMKEYFKAHRDIQRPNEVTPQEQKLEKLIQKAEASKHFQDAKQLFDQAREQCNQARQQCDQAKQQITQISQAFTLARFMYNMTDTALGQAQMLLIQAEEDFDNNRTPSGNQKYNLGKTKCDETAQPDEVGNQAQQNGQNWYSQVETNYQSVCQQVAKIGGDYSHGCSTYRHGLETDQNSQQKSTAETSKSELEQIMHNTLTQIGELNNDIRNISQSIRDWTSITENHNFLREETKNHYDRVTQKFNNANNIQ